MKSSSIGHGDMVRKNRAVWTVWAACALLTGCSQDMPGAPGPLASATESADEKPSRGDLSFVDGYAQGCAVARRDNKPMLVFFTAGWCCYCRQMANEAFTFEPVVNLSDRFVCVLVDADSEGDVCREFRVRAFPTIQFLSPRGVPLNRLTGKQPGPELTAEMQAALQAVARRSDAGIWQ